MTQNLLSEALRPVQDDLSQLAEKIIHYLPVVSRTSKDIIDHVIGSGGKRIRPALFFFAARLTGYKGPHLYPIGAVCEFVHTASLLHDDVVDNSSTRRGKPTANSIWGDQAGVLVGDLMYARASELMAATGSLSLVTSFSRAIRLMSEGEVFQLEQVFNPDITEEDYLRILSYKTSYLIGSCCEAAGFLAGCTEDECHGLASFGKAIGMAFQLIDDCLDYIGDLEEVGKDTLADLKEGKITLPLIALRSRMDPIEKELFYTIVRKPHIDDEDVEAVAKLVEKYDTVDLTIERAKGYTRQAIEALGIFPDCSERRQMENLANSLLSRLL